MNWMCALDVQYKCHLVLRFCIISPLIVFSFLWPLSKKHPSGQQMALGRSKPTL